MQGDLHFRLESTASNSRARAATFRTLHSTVLTPLFMPVGTNATVKGQNHADLDAVGSSVLLANTYHLVLRPGIETFRAFNGIHSFMSWKGSVLTDSGGFQIFSLPHSRSMQEEGAVFKSYVDGEMIMLSPEFSIEAQMAIGSDIMMVLDQCVPSTVDRGSAQRAMERTHRWAKRSLMARGESPQALFAIVQGACFPELRKESVSHLRELPFNGFAVGGLAVGEGKSEREDCTEVCTELLPADLPRYLMGVGTPLDLLEAVHRGIDMFDCILPSALAQQGVAFTFRGKLDLRRGVYKCADEPLDRECRCRTCQTYSRGYLHHLTKTKETLGWQALGYHNLFLYHSLMARLREAILNDTFDAHYRELRTTLGRDDEDNPAVPPKRRKHAKLPSRGNFEIVQLESESSTHFTIRERRGGEKMHSSNDPREEAKQLYVQQSRLVEKLTERSETSSLVVWDVGLGAGTNAMAVVESVLGIQSSLALRTHLISFENDLDAFRLATAHPGLFPHVRHPAPHYLLRDGQWTSPAGELTWELRNGDFLESMETARPPDVIFYDPFSYKVDSPLWTLACFSKLFDCCKDNQTELFTYSAATRVRAAFLAAGFYVGYGEGTREKLETTVALSQSAWLRGSSFRLLGEEWLGRWRKSDARYPIDIDSETLQERFSGLILHHPQFLPRP